MGSFFAGIKAGTLAGVVYFGGLALFNVGVLYAFESETLGAMTRSFSQICTTSSVINSTITGNPQDCFASVVTILIPTAAFLGFFISLVCAGLLGRYYENFPGRHPVVRGETMGVIVGLGILLLGLAGYYFTDSAAILINGFFLVWTVLYGYLLGKLYKRYTREVKFESQDDALLRILVDGRDHTGKSWTFAQTSNHRLRAEVADDASFKEWEGTDGIKLEDSRSFETTMEVTEDGRLKGMVGKKY